MTDNLVLTQNLPTPDDLVIQIIRDGQVYKEEPFVHCEFNFTSENLKYKLTTQSGHSDITVIRKDKLTLGISFCGFQEDVQRVFDLTQEDTVRLSYISPTNGIRVQRTCTVDGLTYNRVKNSEKLDSITNHLGLYDISFTVEEI